MMFLDLLQDFAISRGLSVKFVLQYYELMLPAVGGQQNLKFANMASILLGFEDIWVEIFKIVSVFY